MSFALLEIDRQKLGGQKAVFYSQLHFFGGSSLTDVKCDRVYHLWGYEYCQELSSPGDSLNNRAALLNHVILEGGRPLRSRGLGVQKPFFDQQTTKWGPRKF